MNTTTTMANCQLRGRMRWVVWGGACLLLMLPLVAMQYTSEVNWTLSDFVVMGAMLGLACVSFEIAVRGRAATLIWGRPAARWGRPS